MPFKTFGLSDPLVQGILAAGYTAPTEVQSQAIPAAIAGKDIIGCAQTATSRCQKGELSGRLSLLRPVSWHCKSKSSYSAMADSCICERSPFMAA
jgi:hypothetical protein